MAQGFSLADQLFNADSIGDLAAEFAAGIPGLKPMFSSGTSWQVLPTMN